MDDAIPSQLCSLLYITVDEVAAVAIVLGQGSLIAKIRLTSVHPQDWLWLGVQWQGEVYIDCLRSAPKLFNAFADATEWCVSQKGYSTFFTI